MNLEKQRSHHPELFPGTLETPSNSTEFLDAVAGRTQGYLFLVQAGYLEFSVFTSFSFPFKHCKESCHFLLSCHDSNYGPGLRNQGREGPHSPPLLSSLLVWILEPAFSAAIWPLPLL